MDLKEYIKEELNQPSQQVNEIFGFDKKNASKTSKGSEKIGGKILGLLSFFNPFREQNENDVVANARKEANQQRKEALKNLIEERKKKQKEAMAALIRQRAAIDKKMYEQEKERISSQYDSVIKRMQRETKRIANETGGVTREQMEQATRKSQQLLAEIEDSGITPDAMDAATRMVKTMQKYTLKPDGTPWKDTEEFKEYLKTNPDAKNEIEAAYNNAGKQFKSPDAESLVEVFKDVDNEIYRVKEEHEAIEDEEKQIAEKVNAISDASEYYKEVAKYEKSVDNEKEQKAAAEQKINDSKNKISELFGDHAFAKESNDMVDNASVDEDKLKSKVLGILSTFHADKGESDDANSLLEKTKEKFKEEYGVEMPNSLYNGIKDQLGSDTDPSQIKLNDIKIDAGELNSLSSDVKDGFDKTKKDAFKSIKTTGTDPSTDPKYEGVREKLKEAGINSLEDVEDVQSKLKDIKKRKEEIEKRDADVQEELKSAQEDAVKALQLDDEIKDPDMVDVKNKQQELQSGCKDGDIMQMVDGKPQIGYYDKNDNWVAKPNFLDASDEEKEKYNKGKAEALMARGSALPDDKKLPEIEKTEKTEDGKYKVTFKGGETKTMDKDQLAIEKAMRNTAAGADASVGEKRITMRDNIQKALSNQLKDKSLEDIDPKDIENDKTLSDDAKLFLMTAIDAAKGDEKAQGEVEKMSDMFSSDEAGGKMDWKKLVKDLENSAAGEETDDEDDEEMKTYTGDDEEDDSTEEDLKKIQDDGSGELKDPRTIWKKRKRRDGKGMTKSYWHNDKSISKDDMKRLIRAYNKNKAKATKTNSDSETNSNTEKTTGESLTFSSYIKMIFG